MSDTPETDAATHDLSDYGPPVPCSRGDWVTADYARKLERERDEWRKKFELSVDPIKIAARLARAESERNEAREKYDTLAVENMLEVNKLCKERDEAREQVDRYRDKLDLLPISWEL